MTAKRPIDIKREAPVTLKIGEKNDASTAQELLSTSDTLYVIKGSGVYKVQLADDIDPGRTNLNIPNLNQRVLSEGYDNETVAKILLTTKYLFDEKNATVRPFISSLFEGGMELTKHILELQHMCFSLQEEIRRKEKELLEIKPNQNGFNIPAITDLNTKLHNLIVKADKAKDAILTLYRLLLLPEEPARPKLQKYTEAIQAWPSIEQDFLSSWSEIEKFLTLIRNIRNCSEHPKAGQQIILKDFQMNSNGDIDPPIVQIDHKDTPIGRIPVVELLEFLQKTITDYAENSVVFIKFLTLLDDNPLGEWVSEFEGKERRHPLVRYYRSINVGGKPHVLG